MQALNRLILLLAVSLCPVLGQCLDEPSKRSAAEVALPPGTYGGCEQKMVIGQDGTVSYKDQLHLAQIRIAADGINVGRNKGGRNRIRYLGAETYFIPTFLTPANSN